MTVSMIRIGIIGIGIRIVGIIGIGIRVDGTIGTTARRVSLI